MDFGMKPIKFKTGDKNFFLKPNNEVIDLDTDEIVDIGVDKFMTKLGSMLYYKKLENDLSEMSKEFITEIGGYSGDCELEDSEIEQLSIMFRDMNVVRKCSESFMDYISWDKLEDIIIFDTSNKKRLEYEKKTKNEMEEDEHLPPIYFHNIKQSEIEFNSNSYLLCLIDEETNTHFYREILPKQLINQYFIKITEDHNIVDRDYDYKVKVCQVVYWSHKLKYLSIDCGSDLVVDLTNM
tara:strand:- start:47 stop:760 length:714 start_codon:yes stop_codon:yes gene_type:complete